MYIAVYTMHCTIIYQHCDKSSNSLVSLWTFTNELVIASFFVMKKKACIRLTYADGDISWPLVVVLAGYHLLPDELEPKLAFKAQNISI